MDAPLWTERYAPDLADLPQAEVREYLRKAVDDPINLVLHGPPGAGKTAAVRALAREAHDDPDNDLTILNVSDFFDRTKTEIRNDPRFERFLQGEIPWVKQVSTDRKQDLSKRYKSDWSKAEMIAYVFKQYSSMAPSTGSYKTVVLDNAEDIREDFQQSLRRTMEQFHETTQFVVTTRQPTKLIPPIKSRCFPVAVRAPTTEEITDVLETIAEAEGVEYDEMGLRIVAGYAEGNLREAILSAQTLHEKEGEITRDTVQSVREIGIRGQIEEMLDAAEAGEFSDARKTLDDLLVDEGYNGQEVLRKVLTVARNSNRYTGREEELAELTRLAGEIDVGLAEGSSDRVHLGHLLAELGAKGEA
ncbi:AAA family ATPase [Halorussus caseinilyticus]|uniref:AAA family ATPase n=1 Tax=Halorussus caseinilyticus TaxID=3034025 RepID=UPI0023E7FE52|nr:AAA family ATPase [Halorussus sp. DT72]